MTAFLNALSIFFPPGESFFIRSVQRHKAHPALAGNPELMRAVAGFVGQEAIHSREHEEYNAVLAAAGYPAAPLEGFIDRMLRFLEAVFPISAHLAGTVGLEHLTATMGDSLLRDEGLPTSVLSGAELHFGALWKWHALEEVEHKHVAFDVHEAIYGAGPAGYANRVFFFLFAMVIFWPLLLAMHVVCVYAAGGWAAVFDLRGWAHQQGMLWGKHGTFRRSAPAILDFFRPSFHPWRSPGHDNSAYLARMPALEAAVVAFGKEEAGVANASARVDGAAGKLE